MLISAVGLSYWSFDFGLGYSLDGLYHLELEDVYVTQNSWLIGGDLLTDFSGLTVKSVNLGLLVGKRLYLGPVQVTPKVTAGYTITPDKDSSTYWLFPRAEIAYNVKEYSVSFESGYTTHIYDWNNIQGSWIFSVGGGVKPSFGGL